MLEEECHRNAAFTIFHAAEMPRVSFGAHEVRRLGERLWEVTVELRNDALIPSRTARAAETRTGLPDRVRFSPPEGGRIVASGFVDRRFDRAFDPDADTPAELRLESGVPGRGSRFVRVIVEGGDGSALGVSYSAEKAIDQATGISLAEAKPGA